MKRLLLVLVCLFPLLASADRLDDRREQGKSAVCQVWGVFAAKGALAAYRHIPFKFIYLAPEKYDALMERAQAGEHVKDGLYFKDDGLTENERRFWEDAAEAGYKRMEKMMEAQPGLPEPDWQRMVAALWGVCMAGNEI